MRDGRAAQTTEASVKLGWLGWDQDGRGGVGGVGRAGKAAPGNVDDQTMLTEEIRTQNWPLDIRKKERMLHFKSAEGERKGLRPKGAD